MPTIAQDRTGGVAFNGGRGSVVLWIDFTQHAKRRLRSKLPWLLHEFRDVQWL